MQKTRNDESGRPARWAHITEKTVALLGWLVSPAQSYRWFRFRRAHPAIRDLARLSPSLLSKFHRPYFANGLSRAERVDLLVSHYDFALTSQFGTLLAKGARGPIRLCSFSGKSGVAYRLELSTAGSPNNDGEWVIRLVSGDICIYAVSFLFVGDDGGCAVKIGGLRGMLATSKLVGVRQTTRDLFGCRPKDLMVSLVQAIGGYAGCTKTLLIGNRNKLPHDGQRVCKKSSDYDRTWQEMKASMRENGDFELPCILPSQVDAGYHAAAQSPQLTTLPRRVLLQDAILQKVLGRLEMEKSAARHVSSLPENSEFIADPFPAL